MGGIHDAGVRRLTRGSPVHVYLTHVGRPYLDYDALVVADDGTRIIVRAPWAEPAPRDVGYATFTHGDMFTEHYWRDRWYSVKEIRAADGALKGWYCDVTRPAQVRDSTIISEDLYLDLWVSGDRLTTLVLDEDEFEASGLLESDPDAAAQARGAIEELAEQARAGFTKLALDQS